MRLGLRAGWSVLACALWIACFHPEKRVDFDTPGRSPAALIARSGDAHVVYVDASRRLMHRRGADRSAAIAVSPAGDLVDVRGENAPLFVERRDGALLVIYPVELPTRKTSGSHHHSVSELRAQLSRDGGQTWSTPRRIDGDAASRSHNFADLAVTRSGDTIVSWLDSRAGQQGVQTAVLRSDLSVTPAQTADPKTCQCCKTALFTTSRGEVWLAYRDLAEGKVRNMAYAVSDGAGPFIARGDVADDRWSVNGCPESGPRFAETADGTVWLAWFNGNSNTIEIAAAPRNGSFTKRRPVVAGGVNHPDIGTLPDGRLVVFYEVFRNDKRAIEARVSDAAHTTWSDAHGIAKDGASPRYVRRDDQALLSYTMWIDGAPHVRIVDPLPGLGGK
jgi:hypothetical protein